ncbi:MAG: DUF998 domain-containing protein [Candidatus Helarchaeota archaeon]
MLRETIRRMCDETHFPFFGLGGSTFFLIFIAIAIVFYNGSGGTRFSIQTQMISELGEVGSSSVAILFNGGMIIGGLIYIPFIIGLGSYFNHKLAKASMTAGLIAAISCILIGFVPMNYGHLHMIIALLFFLGNLFSITFFNFMTLSHGERKLPKVFLIPGALIMVIFLTYFLNFILFEWILFYSLNGYLILAALYLIINIRNTTQST